MTEFMWTRRDGTQVPLTMMSDRHLKNAVADLLRSATATIAQQTHDMLCDLHEHDLETRRSLLSNPPIEAYLQSNPLWTHLYVEACRRRSFDFDNEFQQCRMMVKAIIDMWESCL